MKIILDVMGGDKSPEEFVRGAVMATRARSDLKIVLAGDEALIRRALLTNLADRRRFELMACSDAITMEDDPFDVVRKKSDSSMARALKYLADGNADAMVSAGNTGALFAGATVIVRPVKGVRRGAIGTVIPFDRPLLLLDSGANVTASAEFLLQFAFLGEAYCSLALGISKPEVGLLNNGTESHKGTPVVSEAYQLMKNSSLNFVGNIEGKDIPRGKCDVLVTDGFTGNIVLKYSEGLSSFMFRKVKDVMMMNMATQAAALTLKKPLSDLKSSFNADEYGGAPILGLSKPIIKAHGSSDCRAIKNALLRAAKYAESGVIEKISDYSKKFQIVKPDKKD